MSRDADALRGNAASVRPGSAQLRRLTRWIAAEHAR